MKLALLVLVLAACMGCGEDKWKKKEYPPLGVSGTYHKTDTGKLRAFEAYASTSNPLVVLVGSFGCLGCAMETESMQEHLAMLGLPPEGPEGVNMLSVLVGASLEDARDIQYWWDIRWDMGYQVDAQVLDDYCPRPYAH